MWVWIELRSVGMRSRHLTVTLKFNAIAFVFNFTDSQLVSSEDVRRCLILLFAVFHLIFFATKRNLEDLHKVPIITVAEENKYPSLQVRIQGVFQPEEPRKLRENKLTQGNHGKLRKI